MLTNKLLSFVKLSSINKSTSDPQLLYRERKGCCDVITYVGYFAPKQYIGSTGCTKPEENDWVEFVRSSF